MEDINVFVSIKEQPLKEVSPGICVDEDGRPIFKTEYSDEIKLNDGDIELVPVCYNCAGERWHGDFNKLVRSVVVE